MTAVKKPRPPSPIQAFRTNMDAMREAYRKLVIAQNRENPRMQAWPSLKRKSNALILAEGAHRAPSRSRRQPSLSKGIGL